MGSYELGENLAFNQAAKLLKSGDILIDYPDSIDIASIDSISDLVF